MVQVGSRQAPVMGNLPPTSPPPPPTSSQPFINPSTTTQGDKRSRSSSSSPSSALEESHHDGDLATTPPFMMGGDGDAIPSAPTKPSLATFLRDDIHPEHGHRLLLPFLTTMDRLCLSECCRCLLVYRHHLSRMKLRRHPSLSTNPTLRMALDKLLMSQDPSGGGGLEYHVGDASLMTVLDLASQSGCFERLKTLDVYDLSLEAEHFKHLERVLLGGGLEGLEELDLFRSDAVIGGREGGRRILGALGRGTGPRLRRLDIRWIGGHWDGGSLGAPLADALESGHLRHLQELASTLLEGDMAAVARALEGGACPHLTKLNVSGSIFGPEGGQALAAAMRTGALRKLQELYLGDYVGGEIGLDDQGLVAIFRSFEAGSCPSLRQLGLEGLSMGAPTATALVQAMRSGSCPHLNIPSLLMAFSDPEASLPVFQAISQAGRWPMYDPLYLLLRNAQLGPGHGRVLAEAMGDGAFPQLEVLVVSDNPGLGDGGIVAIMAGLEGGGCRHLRELKMGSISMGPPGGQALGRALASGKLSCLQWLELGDNSQIGDAAMKEVMVGLQGCHQLWMMVVRRTSMGREAGGVLVQGLWEGAWPQLRWLCLGDDPGVFADEEVGRGLVELIEGGKLSQLENLEWRCVGLSRELLARILGAVERGACPRLCWMTVNASDVEQDWKERLWVRWVSLDLGTQDMIQ